MTDRAHTSTDTAPPAATPPGIADTYGATTVATDNAGTGTVGAGNVVPGPDCDTARGNATNPKNPTTHATNTPNGRRPRTNDDDVIDTENPPGHDRFPRRSLERRHHT